MNSYDRLLVASIKTLDWEHQMHLIHQNWLTKKCMLLNTRNSISQKGIFKTIVASSIVQMVLRPSMESAWIVKAIVKLAEVLWLNALPVIKLVLILITMEKFVIQLVLNKLQQMRKKKYVLDVPVVVSDVNTMILITALTVHLLYYSSPPKTKRMLHVKESVQLVTCLTSLELSASLKDSFLSFGSLWLYSLS